MIDPITQLSFSIVENPGVYALLIGSGVSRAAEIPTGWEIILDLCHRIALAEGAKERPDWDNWYRERFGSEPNYSSLLDALSLTASERRSILHNYIEPTPEDLNDGRRLPTRAHKAVARLVQWGFIRVLITTNFDRLLETALREAGVEPTVVRSVDDLAGASPIMHSRCYIVKLHGDYLDNRILNTDRELAVYPLEFDVLLDRILDEFGLIVCGWSGEWDPALRAAIARAPNRRYPTYWASRGEPSKGAADLIAHRAARLVQVQNADDFFERVQQTVETLHKTRRQRPEATELLLAGTKRFLAKPEYRIELHDLVNGEAERVMARIRSGDFPTSMPNVTWDVMRERWDAMEALSEPLARVMGLLGRWGDGEEFNLASDTLRALLDQPSEGGNGVLLGLRTYGAYLCFVTYALGLTKAQRFDELCRWFTINIERPGRPTRKAANHVFMSFWADAKPDWWKQRAPQYENRKTPWADYLVDHILPWSHDYGMTGQQALATYNMMELLGGFASLSDHSAETLNSLNDDFMWMPCGRLMWASDDRTATLAQLESNEMHPRILAAGFSNGSEDHWQGVKKNIDLIARRIGW